MENKNLVKKEKWLLAGTILIACLFLVNVLGIVLGMGAIGLVGLIWPIIWIVLSYSVYKQHKYVYVTILILVIFQLQNDTLYEVFFSAEQYSTGAIVYNALLVCILIAIAILTIMVAKKRFPDSKIFQVFSRKNKDKKEVEDNDTLNT